LKVIILAGGFGTRLSEYTERIPKPMVKIGGKPILWHIMQRYADYSHKDFYIALGYKSEVIKEYFLKFNVINSNFKIDLNNGKVKTFESKNFDWKVSLIDTGINSMTGGRLKRLQSQIGKERFMLTYGDGLSDIDFKALLDFHNSHKKMVTVSAVRPVARFGEIELDENKVTSFKEKPQVNKGWINGGFFIFEPEFFDLIKDDSTVLEKDPLESAAQMGELMAFKHEGFWQCMDTKRDKDFFEEMYKRNETPWIVNPLK
tara:strand:+ start:729 stop:1505 length:777 start_codon:yes stop_codon:yes gene_type:complete